MFALSESCTGDFGLWRKIFRKFIFDDEFPENVRENCVPVCFKGLFTISSELSANVRTLSSVDWRNVAYWLQ